MSLLGQIYVVSALVGSVFIIFNFVVGQFGDSSGDDGGDDAGTASADDFSQADDGGTGGDDFASADSSATGGHDFNAADGGTDTSPAAEARAAMGTYAVSVTRPTSSRALTGHSDTDVLTRLGFLVLRMLSPMAMAMFLAFFGCAGFIALHFWPALGLLTLIPAVLVAVLISSLFKAAVRWMMKHLESSSLAEVTNLIGQVGEINIPIHKGRTGEITYVVQSKRFSSPAKAADSNLELERGAKVMIVDTNQQVMMVEPYSD